MGCCVSTSNQSTCSSHSTAEAASSSCRCLGMSGRRRSKRMFTNHVTALQQLPSIPNRIFTNGSSRTSCIFTQQGRKGVNQDAMIVWEDFMMGDMTLCGIFDGHGPHGHLVARKVRDNLPIKLISFLNQTREVVLGVPSSAEDKNPGGGEAEKNSLCEDRINDLWKEAFLKSYKAMDKELKSHPNVDCFCSGSTAVTIVKQGQNLFIGNIGDSRAIMGSKDENGSLMAIQLTVDLKPDLPREAERIKRCKGRVFAMQDEPDVHRVWLPFDDAPGLAMARAFGDFCLKEYGVISVPEFTQRTLTERDQFLVLATDGVWDVLSNEEVVEQVSSAPSRSSAARMLTESAAREWKLKYPTSKMDDCAVVCLYLDGKMDPESGCDDRRSSSAALHRDGSGGASVKSDDGQDSEPCLQRNFTVRSGEENHSFRRLPVEATENTTGEDQNWSGLEGITRVNSIVQLPRFSDERPRL